MKIISLRFANLNSLPGPHLIRFDAAPLADTGLFAIIGPTGAGKSTLLDAIAVGLYGRVPRHDRQVGEMVSRHAPGAWSEVEFEVHQTDADTGQAARVRYRSRWEVRRKTRGDDKGGLGQDAMTLVFSPSGEAVTSGKEAVPAKVSELSGLDFGQFEQAVLLSQGKFARFLHAPEKERSALLEKMTNVGIYSQLSVAAFEKAKAEKQQTELLAARLDATRLLTDDERRALDARLDALSEAAEQHHEEAQELNVGLTWRTILDQLDRQLRDTAREAAALRQAGEALAPEFARLAGHQRAHALATPLALAEAAKQSLAKNTAQLAQVRLALPGLADLTQATAHAFRAATDAHAAAQTEADHLRPVLELARTQDAAIATTGQRLRKDLAAHAQNEQAHAQDQAAWQQQAGHLRGLAEQQTTLDDWLIAHGHEADLKDQLYILGRELSDLQGAQKEIAAHEARREELLKNHRATAADLGRQRQLAAGAEARQQAIRDEGQPCRTERDELLRDTTPAALAQRADDLTAYLQGVQQLLPKVEAADQHQARADELAAHFQQEAPTLATAETAVRHLAARRADGQQLLESLRRELRAQQALADLNAHRHQLQAGQPCPLCGAREHAFAPDFAPDADAQEQHVARQQQALAVLDEELRVGNQDLTRRQTEQRQRHGQQQEAAAAAATARHQARELAAALAPTPPPPANLDLPAVRELLAATATAQAAAGASRRRLATLDEKLALLREKYLAAGQSAADAQGEIRLLAQRQEATERELSQLATELAHWREQADIYQSTMRELLQPHQLPLPPRAPYDGLLATLDSRATHYQTQRAALDAGRQQLVAQTIQHQAQAAELARRHAQLTAEGAALAAEQRALDEQRAARRAHYPGPDPAAAEAALRRHTEQLAEAARQAERQHARQQQELAVQHSAAEALHTQLAALSREHDARQLALAAALTAAGFADAAEARALLLPPPEAERLHQRHQDHLTATAATARRLADFTAEHQHHAAVALTPRSAPELTAQLAALSAADDILQQQLGAVSNQLVQDDAARQQLAAGLRELQARRQEEQRWQDLAEQIGSARGDKFAQFAQGLTLSHLARLANLRLRQLTGRYTILKRPNRDLELQIIDHDQADTVRPMASLSGGESFLVSLALALGLSELAGYKARIESLFIDEGFGTLDPDALNTALDALERLQHSGKMIGIISHVADLKERIGTQIRVQPGAGGNSTVRVVDVAGTETSCEG